MKEAKNEIPIFLERARGHVGNLIRLRQTLYWYSKYRSDNKEERVCLLLEVRSYIAESDASMEQLSSDAAVPVVLGEESAVLLLLIEGEVKWVFVIGRYVDFLQDSE